MLHDIATIWMLGIFWWIIITASTQALIRAVLWGDFDRTDALDALKIATGISLFFTIMITGVVIMLHLAR